MAPTVGMHRSPLDGQDSEYASEDPHLSARMAAAYVKGVQSRTAGTSVTHCVCSDSGSEHNRVSSGVTQRALRETCLSPFGAVAQQAETWSVLAAYNNINMADWCGTSSTAHALIGGVDPDMPGPPTWRGERLRAFRDGHTLASGPGMWQRWG